MYNTCAAHRYFVHMYKSSARLVKDIYNRIDTGPVTARTQDINQLGVPYPPPIYLGGAIFKKLHGGALGQACPGPPKPPLHLAHTLGGSCLNCPRYTCPKSKNIKQ